MAWKIILFFALIALSESKPPTSEQRVKIENMLSHIGSQEQESEEVYASSYPFYEFTYEVSDPHTHDFKGHHEQRKGYEVKGYYWLIQPDGLKRTVKYHADKHSGFKAQVEYIKLIGGNENAIDETNNESNAVGENDNAGNVNSEENYLENVNGAEGENNTRSEEGENSIRGEEGENNIRGEEGENSVKDEEGKKIEETNRGEQEESEQEDNNEGSYIQENEQTGQSTNRGRNDVGRTNTLNNNENLGREQQNLLKSWNRVKYNLRRQQSGNEGSNVERHQGRNNKRRSRGENNIREENFNRGAGIWQPNKVNMWGQRHRNKETRSDERRANNEINSRSVETGLNQEGQNLASNGANDNINGEVTEGNNQESSRQDVEQGNRGESRRREGHRGGSRREGNRNGESTRQEDRGSRSRRGQRRGGETLDRFRTGNRNEESLQQNDTQRSESNENQERKEEQEQRTSSNENNLDGNGGNSIENENIKIIKSEYHVIIHHPKKHRG